ncbi:unnamed protein product [Phaeothamnion confervicola]
MRWGTGVKRQSGGSQACHAIGILILALQALILFFLSRSLRLDDGDGTTTPLVVLPPLAGGAARRLSLFSTLPRNCVPQNLQPALCDNDARRVKPEPSLRRRTCAHSVTGEDVIFGVWHSLATEHRLQPLLDTWGNRTTIALLASRAGVKGSRLFAPPGPAGWKGGPMLVDTGMAEDDYFSTLGKAFIGLRLMLERFPAAKWFAILGDDNFVVLENYLNLLSAFNPDEPWALTRMVYRDSFRCKVAGGAGIVTSAALTRALAPDLEPFFRDIVARAGGDVRRAAQEDKFHDLAFQRMVETHGGGGGVWQHRFIHLEELLHEPPGFYFNAKGPPRPGAAAGAGIRVPRGALFHYVPGAYMYYLDFVAAAVCTCESTAVAASELASVVAGVYSTDHRLSRLELARITSSWGASMDFRPLLPRRQSTALQRLRALRAAVPTAAWLLFVPVGSYVVSANVAARLEALRENSVANHHAKGGGGDSAEVCLYGDEAGDGGVLLSAVLADRLLATDAAAGVESSAADTGLPALVHAVAPAALLADDGFMASLPAWSPETAVTHRRGEGGGTGVGSEKKSAVCPVTFPMTPDLADLKIEFAFSEDSNVMAVTRYLLESVPRRQCGVHWGVGGDCCSGRRKPHLRDK